MNQLQEISLRLQTQDNRITSHPMFCVQKKVRDVGYDSIYCDNSCWVDTNYCESEVLYDDDEGFNADRRALYDETDGLEEFGYRDRWETVMVCFTEGGCNDYMAVNGHNVKDSAFRGEVRIYAESYYRCAEMIAIREALMKGQI